MGKKQDDFIKKLFQKPYEFFKKLRAPSFIVKLTNLVCKYVKIPALGEIIKVAYEISKEVEKDSVPGWIKKQKVVAGINKFAKSLGYEVPKVAANFINELVALYIKLVKKF